MKPFNITINAIAMAGSLALAASTFAAEAGKSADAKSAKPYTLKTCIVSDEKLGGDMGKPYVFVHEGQEFKLCCKGCLKDFNKEPAKYVKKLAEAQKSAKKGAGVPAQAHSSEHPH